MNHSIIKFLSFSKITLFICIILFSCNKTDETEEHEIKYSWIPVGYQLEISENFDELNSWINIVFINEQTGFLSHKENNGYSFVRTGDSCLSFIDISDQIDGYVEEICFPDDQTGYLVTNNYSLYKTIDQGENWNKIESIENGQVIQIGSNYPENVFVMNKVSYNSFLYSNDGGISWTEYDLELDLFFGLEEVKFQFLEENPDIGFFNNMHSIYKTSDGGDSWEEYFEFTEYNSLSHYWFINEDIAYISCGLGIYKTTDGGSNFQKLDSFSARYWQVLSENEMYVAQVVVVQRTFDEFENLEVMEVNTQTNNKYDRYIRDISFYESKKGYAISGNGHVYKTAE